VEVVIEQARPDDAVDIQRIVNDAWEATYPNEEHGITIEDIRYKLAERFAGENLERHRQNLANPPAGRKTLVAKVDGRVVGMCSLIKNKNYNQLKAINVTPKLHGKGIGKALWNEALEWFDSEKDIIVQTVTYNEQAKRFYESLGFVDTGKRFEEERFRMKNGNVLPEMEMVLRRK